MDKNTLYANGLPVGTVVGIEGDFTAVEKRAIDCADAEPRGATTGRALHAFLAASAFLAGSPFGALGDRTQASFYAEMLQGSPRRVWSTWRTRNLSHRPTAGARKRKAALKHAARTHRTVMAERHYG